MCEDLSVYIKSLPRCIGIDMYEGRMTAGIETSR
jgi:hypothetical protein